MFCLNYVQFPSEIILKCKLPKQYYFLKKQKDNTNTNNSYAKPYIIFLQKRKDLNFFET